MVRTTDICRKGRYVMGKYSNGLETKNRILDICREFFYEKGYESTTFKDISSALDINQSAIHYHFKSKEKIMRMIYEDTIRKNNELVEFYSDRSTCDLAKMFFDIEIYMYKIWNDEKYRNFYINATKGWDQNEFMDAGSKFIYRSDAGMNEVEEEKIGEDTFNQIALGGFDQAVLRFINNNIEKLDYRKTFMATIWMYKKILNIPDDEYKKARKDLAILEQRCKWDEMDTSLSE